MRQIILAFLVCAVYPVVVRSQTPEEKKATIAILLELQQPDGSFGLVSPKQNPNLAVAKGDIRSTSSALRALKYFGGAVKDPKLTAKFVESCFDKSKGGFGLRPEATPDVVLTAVGLMAVVELKMPTEPYVGPATKFLADNAKTFEEIRMAAAGFEAIGKPSPKADAWLGEIAKMRNPDGTYGKGTGAARATGSAAAAVLRLGGKLEQPENIIKLLKSGQRLDGGWGKEEEQASDLETTYRVMRSLMMLKDKPDEAKLRAFVAKCRNADGGYGIAPGQKSNVGATYFASIILHWMDQK
jgi:prenyltransferase beta subunit